MKAAIAFAVLGFTSFAAGAEPNYQELKQQFLDSEKKYRDEKVESLTKRVESTEATFKRTSRNMEYRKWLGIKAELNELSEQLERAKKFELLVNPKKLEEGDFARVGSGDRSPLMKILQVVDKSNAIMTWGDETYWMELDTKGLVDDKPFVASGFLYHKGTKTYPTANGATKTVVLFVFVK